MRLVFVLKTQRRTGTWKHFKSLLSFDEREKKSASHPTPSATVNMVAVCIKSLKIIGSTRVTSTWCMTKTFGKPLVMANVKITKTVL